MGWLFDLDHANLVNYVAVAAFPWPHHWAPERQRLGGSRNFWTGSAVETADATTQ
jgi:hypothetical protein